MVDRAEIYQAADRLRGLKGKEAVRVSVRRVRDELKRGGSFTDVGNVLKEWKNARKYHPVIEMMKLPEALKKRIGDLGRALLEEVRADESQVHDVERENFEIERAHFREVLDEAGMTVDGLEARVAALTAEVERLRKGGAKEIDARTPEQIAEAQRPKDVHRPFGRGQAMMSGVMDRRLPAGAQDLFWQDVEREVWALLRKQGPMYPGDLLLGLPETLLTRGSQVEMPLSVGWLRYRLRAMAAQGGGLAESEGRFVPVEERTAATPATPRPPGPPAHWMVDEKPPTTDGDAVMRDVRDVLVREGPLMPSEIVGRLPIGTAVLASRFWADGLEHFAKKMSERVGPKTYFHPLGDGRYAAGPKPKGEQVKRLRGKRMADCVIRYALRIFPSAAAFRPVRPRRPRGGSGHGVRYGFA